MTTRQRYDAIQAYLASHPRTTIRGLMRATGCSEHEARRFREAFLRHRQCLGARSQLTNPQTAAEELVASIYIQEMKSLIRQRVRKK